MNQTWRTWWSPDAALPPHGNTQLPAGDAKVLNAEHRRDGRVRHRTLDHVAQLANIARPRVRLEGRDRIGAELGSLLPFGHEARDEHPRERHDVIDALALQTTAYEKQADSVFDPWVSLGSGWRAGVEYRFADAGPSRAAR